MKRNTVQSMAVTLGVMVWLPGICLAQINSGSDGSDGPFNPTSNTNINMSARTNGIYQYTSVNIPSNVTVTFTANANNTPVVWLVQSDVTIIGTVNVSGASKVGSSGGLGGPGGYTGGSLGSTPAQGPGAGDKVGASYGSLGSTGVCSGTPGPIYGNDFLIPLLGGSGGGANTGPGGGGGGALLIATSGTIDLRGTIAANGGAGGSGAGDSGGGGSGGAVRLVASAIVGSGRVSALGGGGNCGSGGRGRVRFDTYMNSFTDVVGVFTQGSNFIIIPTAGLGTPLRIVSVAGNSVLASPTGLLTTPDALLSSQESNPISIVVQCTDVPLNTAITVTVSPANGAPAVSAVGTNTTGSLESSTATVSINMPRGGGYISASAAISN